MLFSKLTAVLFFATIICKAQNNTNMFLGTASHVPLKNSFSGDCFNETSWKFNANAAIRSTPVSDNKNIYFGTERGDLFCVDQSTGKPVWKFSSAYPIHTSPALQNGIVFFSDAKQTLYALSASTGKMIWQTFLGENKPYEWKFDFLWSSPTISGNTIFIGSSDHNLYAIQSQTGKVIWKFATTAHIRCAPAVADGKVFFGDMNGYFYALDNTTGKEKWKFETNAIKFVNDSFGFDRKGIVASPVVIGNKIIFGSRDGYMYNLNTETGKSNWVFNYDITWVISSVATDGKAVYAGTSDGSYVNAIDLQTGKELWKSKTNIVWSSPTLVNDKLYVGGYDGFLYCMNKNTGVKMNTPLYTGSRIQSSPVVAGNKLFIGSDDGFMYALKSNGTCKEDKINFSKYVFYERDAPRLYYRNGTDLLLRASLTNTGFRQIDSKVLEELFKRDIPSDSNVVVVLASNFLPASVLQDGKNSLLRKFLDKGGRIVITGLDPVVYNIDPKTNQIKTDYDRLKDILDIDYKYRDFSRPHGGVVYCGATKQGINAGLPQWWMAPFSISKDQVDIVLGENVDKDASAYVKKYTSKANSGLIQIWIDAEFIPADVNFIRKIALADL